MTSSVTRSSPVSIARSCANMYTLMAISVIPVLMSCTALLSCSFNGVSCLTYWYVQRDSRNSCQSASNFIASQIASPWPAPRRTRPLQPAGTQPPCARKHTQHHDRQPCWCQHRRFALGAHLNGCMPTICTTVPLVSLKTGAGAVPVSCSIMCDIAHDTADVF
jgi:hypothetical protein